MNDPVIGDAAVKLLKAYGFELDAKANCLVRQAFARIAGHSSEAVRIEVRDASDGGAPHEGTTAYRAVCSSVASDNGLLRDIAFASGNAADIAAFTVACVAVMKFHVGLEPEEWETFGFRNTCIYNCFGDPNYGDWIVVDRSENEIVVAHPEETYGDTYLRWRDGLLESVASLRADDGLSAS